MNTATLEQDGALWRLRGAITVATVGALEPAIGNLVSTDDSEVALDSGEMEVADSAAIALMVEIAGQLKAQGRSLRVTGLRNQTEKLIHLYGVEWILGGEG